MPIAVTPSIPQKIRALAQQQPELREQPDELARRLGLMTSQVRAALHADKRRLRPDGNPRR